MFDLDVNEQDKQEAEGLVKQSVKIPSGAFCRILLYDICSPRKAVEESRRTRVKLTMLDGLDVKMAVTSFFASPEAKDETTVIDFSDPNDIKLPLGESGFKNMIWFRCSEGWLKFQKMAIPQDERQAKLLFNTWLEKQIGIPFEMSKNILNGGIMFNAYRYWHIKPNKEGKDEYKSWITPWNKELKSGLTDAEKNIEVISPELTASIITAITPVDDTPF